MRPLLALIAIACLCRITLAGAPMDRVGVSADGKGFVLNPSHKPFHPWGHNYASNDGLGGPAQRPWEKVESDLTELKAMRANIIRVHLQFPQFMDSPARPNASAFERLSHLLALAEKHGIYLDITGLACYDKKQRAAWYDALPDEQRWAAQARFWQEVAKTCADSPAVFCYDLINEPIVLGTRKDGWYTGELGGYEFLQRLSLDQNNRPRDDISAEWTRTMVAAIHARDKSHLITIGMLPAWGISPKAVAKDLDFISVHIYPARGEVDEAIATLKRFDIGLPIVIEETFPLSCGVEDERAFLLKSRQFAAGWLGHYPDDSPTLLRANKRDGKLTLPQAISLSWIELFEDLGPQMQQ